MAKQVQGLLADRLTRLLTAELEALEAGAEDNSPADEVGMPQRKPGDAKARVDALGQITRTLEKLLELRRLEALALASAGAGDEAETRKLRDELMKRLRLLDRRRQAGAGLFAREGAA